MSITPIPLYRIAEPHLGALASIAPPTAAAEPAGVTMGSWPDWVAATGSILAFGAVATTLIRDMVLRRRDRADAMAQQARLVTSKSGQFVNHHLAHREFVIRCPITVTNDSAAPIKKINPRLWIEAENRFVATAVQDPSAAHSIGAMRSEVLYVLVHEEIPTEGIFAVTHIEFLDANGVRWRSINDGAPIQLFEKRVRAPRKPKRLVDEQAAD